MKIIIITYSEEYVYYMYCADTMRFYRKGRNLLKNYKNKDYQM